MADLKTNVLYYGDNLDILREHTPDESINLIYLDPPSTPIAPTTSSFANRLARAAARK